MATKNELIEAEARSNELMELYDPEDTGLGDMGKDDFSVPFLRILQKTSPQCSKQKSEYIKEAEEGMLFNTGTMSLYDGEASGIKFVPCLYTRNFIEWVKIEDGGGMVGQYAPSDPAVIDAQRTGNFPLETLAGNDLVETFTYVGLIIKEDGLMDQAVLSMASTQGKKAKQWNARWTAIKFTRSDGSMIQAPMWSHAWDLMTVPESNDKGDWYGWKIGAATQLSKDQFLQAAAFRSQLNSGTIKVASPETVTPEDDTSDAF